MYPIPGTLNIPSPQYFLASQLQIIWKTGFARKTPNLCDNELNARLFVAGKSRILSLYPRSIIPHILLVFGPVNVKRLAYQKFQQTHVINRRNVAQNLELQVPHQFSHRNVDRCSYEHRTFPQSTPCPPLVPRNRSPPCASSGAAA